MLFDPDSHEPLLERRWDPDAVSACIHAIARDADEALRPGGTWWPWHPRDLEPGDPDVVHGVYLGAAGVVWALDRLTSRGLHSPGHDYAQLALEVLASHRARPEFGDPARSVWMGELGVALVAWLLSPDPAIADRLAELVAVEPAGDTLELMWGSPGQLVAADVMFERTGSRRFESASSALAEHLVAQRGASGFWTQRLPESSEREVVGAAHGFAGVVAALARRHDGLLPGVTAALRSTVVRDGALANWLPVVGEPLEDNGNPIRTQWCHGAPGVVASLAGLPADDELDELLLAGGELTWTAGPLRKGANLCHGTAGNGFAFLKLFARTGDERWLDRARAFAMHAAAQVSAAREEYGRGRYTLWTGDLGTALYLGECLTAGSALPAIDAW